MKHLTQNKYWRLNEEYNLDKILYLLIDRPDYVSENNIAHWINNKKQPHRGYSLPAVIYSNGRKCWFLNGELHRENGPAIEWSNGTKYWFLNGKRHRENGPAIEWSNGSKEWFLNGIKQLRYK